MAFTMPKGWAQTEHDCSSSYGMTTSIAGAFLNWGVQCVNLGVQKARCLPKYLLRRFKMRRIRVDFSRISSTCDAPNVVSAESIHDATHPRQIRPNQSTMRRTQRCFSRINSRCDASKTDSAESVHHAAHPRDFQPNHSNLRHIQGRFS